MQFLVNIFLKVQNFLQHLYILEITSNSVLHCKCAVVLGIGILPNKILFFAVSSKYVQADKKINRRKTFLQPWICTTKLPSVMALPHLSPLPLPSWTGMLSDFIILCCCDWWWWWCCWWCCWGWGASTVLLVGTEEGGKLLPPAGVPTAPPEAMAGAMSFRPKFSKLLETLLMFRGAALALALRKEEEKLSHHCQRFGQAQPYMHHSSKLGDKNPRFERYKEGVLLQLHWNTHSDHKDWVWYAFFPTSTGQIFLVLLLEKCRLTPNKVSLYQFS